MKESISDIAVVLIVGILAVAGLWAVVYLPESINQTPLSKEFYIVEYLDETAFSQGSNENPMTGMLIAEDQLPAEARTIMDNEPPSHFRARTYYGCYKRCICSGATACQCSPGGCIKRN